MKIEDFDYDLPEELIAQTPLRERPSSKLLIMNRKEKTITHRHFNDILEYLHPGDCLVLNNTKVLPARLYGIKKDTGAKIELLLRSEEHTSELQSRFDLVCRLLLEKKKENHPFA